MTNNANTIEVIARGVCVQDGSLLLCRNQGATRAYLPGGHVEFRETARQALAREMIEELGHTAEVGCFLGCCEHAFLQQDMPHAEINLVFEMRVPGLSVQEPLVAREPWLGFAWHPLDHLADAQLEPALLGSLLMPWLRQPGGHVVSGTGWELPVHHSGGLSATQR